MFPPSGSYQDHIERTKFSHGTKISSLAPLSHRESSQDVNLAFHGIFLTGQPCYMQEIREGGKALPVLSTYTNKDDKSHFAHHSPERRGGVKHR